MRSSALLCLFVSFVLMAIFWRTLTVKIPAFFSAHPIDQIWPWLMLFPVVASALAIWMQPIHVDLVGLGRVHQVMVVILTLILFIMWVLCHLAWHIVSHMEVDVLVKGK